MNKSNPYLIPAFILGLLLVRVETVVAEAVVQCPGDINGDAIVDMPVLDDGGNPRNIKCMHLSGGDGFATMANGRLQYIFAFGDLTGIPQEQAIDAGILGAELPSPTIVLDEADEFFLTLTNVGMIMRPDLSDPHTVHFHGFPNASAIFDGLPDASISVNMLSSLTYYYSLVEPGTYLYHCHVEATEHMQMGMIGNLYVRPAQNRTGCADGVSCPQSQLGGNPDISAPAGYVYNDGDGSTAYDVEAPIQITSLDPAFHDASMNTQPLPFANMKDTFPLLNGRGYPDTINPGALIPPAENGGKVTQKVSSLVNANVGDKILLRISNVSITRFYTLSTLGLTMKVVGRGARLLRGPDGIDLSYDTASVTLGGGESVDVIIDTAGVTTGTYFLYTTNLNYLSNDVEDFGGMMTEIRIN
ncbi:MAG TPA: multicopper oxidase domain-containing protein [Gammaproteobacteria bacterium]